LNGGAPDTIPKMTVNVIAMVTCFIFLNIKFVLILKDPKDAEYAIGTVDLHQWSLEMNAVNVHDTSAKSQLKLLENVGLIGTLSMQAVYFVSCYSM